LQLCVIQTLMIMLPQVRKVERSTIVISTIR
jgi:hypothetical protein